MEKCRVHPPEAGPFPLKKTSRVKRGIAEASIERGFLVVHCPLKDIATHLPALKNAVVATNTTHKQYVQEQTTERERREDVWTQERKAVDDMAGGLHFE